MARQALNRSYSTRSPPNTGDSDHLGDTWDNVLVKLNTMFTEVYAALVTAAAATAAAAKYTKNTTSGATTAAAGDLTGALTVTAEYSAVGAAALTTRTAVQMFADAGAVVGQAYELAIMNTSGGTTTLTAGSGVTLTGTMTMATNTVRWFVVTFTSATAVTIQNAGSGAI